MQELERAGYAIEPLADAPGIASRRGGIIDVFPAGAERPFRIEFFGDDIESIRELDLVTQRSVARLEELHIRPAATSSSGAKAAAKALLERVEANGDQAEVVIEQLELLADGNRSPFAGFFEPLLHGHSALDHLSPGALVILDEPDEGEAALATAIEHDERTRSELESRGMIPQGLPDLREAPVALGEAVRPVPGRGTAAVRHGRARGAAPAALGDAELRREDSRAGAAGQRLGEAGPGGRHRFAAGPPPGRVAR